MLKLAVAGGLTPSLIHDLSDPLARVVLGKDHRLELDTRTKRERGGHLA